MKLIQKLKQYIQDLKSWATSEVNPTPEQRQDLIDEFIKEKARSLMNDKMNNDSFTATELYYIAENIKVELSILLEEKSQKRIEYCKQLEEIRRQEENIAKEELEVSKMLKIA